MRLVATLLSVFLASAPVEAALTITYRSVAPVVKNREGVTRMGAPGGTVEEGETVSVPAGGRVEFRMGDGSLVRLQGPASFGYEADKPKQQSFVMSNGRFWANVVKKADRRFTFRTPTSVLGVRGTVFRGDVSREETLVRTYEGEVAAWKAGAEEAAAVLLSKLEETTVRSEPPAAKAPFDEQQDEQDAWVKWNKARDKLRVMILMQEDWGEKAAQAPKRSTMETVITRRVLNNYLFRPVSQEQVDTVRGRPEAAEAVKGDAGKAARLALQFASDLAVIGGASVSFVSDPALAGMISCVVEGTAKAMWTDTGEVIAAASQEARAVDLTEKAAGAKALTEVGEKLTRELEAAVAASWRREAKSGAVLDVIVYGVDYRKADAVRGALAGQPGVKEANLLYLLGDQALFGVKFPGDPSELAAGLSGLKVADAAMRPVGVSARRLELEIEPAP